MEIKDYAKYFVYVLSIFALAIFFGLTKNTLFLASAFGVGLVGFVWIFLYPFLRKRVGTISVDVDLVYLLQHMHAISTGKPARHVLFRVVGEEKAYGYYSEIFKKIYTLGRNWGYSLAEACRLVAKSVENKVLRELLGRFSAILSMGGDIELFLKTEYNTLMTEYETIYNRVVEASNIFYGIHTSLLASGVFMIANFMILIFFFGGGLTTLYTSYTIVLITMLSIAILLYVLVPKDLFENNLKPHPYIYKLADYIALAGITASIVLTILTIRRLGLTFTYAASLMASLGTSLLIAGYIAKRIDSLIEDVDMFFPVFIRSYGMHLKVTPNMAKALEPLLITELGKLKKPITNLYSRLVNGSDPQVSWRLFAAETRSELAKRAVKIFIDTVENGGDPAITGASLSDHYNELARLRRRKFQIGKTFETTTYLMHGAATLIVVFIVLLIQKFSLVLSTVQAMMPAQIGIFIFTPGITEASTWVSSLFLFILAVINAFCIRRAVPSSKRVLYYYLGVLLIITSIGILAGEFLMNYMLGSAVEELFKIVGTLPT